MLSCKGLPRRGQQRTFKISPIPVLKNRKSLLTIDPAHLDLSTELPKVHEPGCDEDRSVVSTWNVALNIVCVRGMLQVSVVLVDVVEYDEPGVVFWST